MLSGPVNHAAESTESRTNSLEDLLKSRVNEQGNI